jgi:glycosyltransferase involved in cell wall biosynthesis
MPSKPFLSLIVPTRKRTDQLRTLLQSLKKNTRNLEQVEVVLVVDADDEQSKTFHFPQISMKRVVVEPGLPMAELNMAGYEASAGDFLMLLNDDVIVRTRRWDRQVHSACQRFSDGIVLVHVNDTLFGEGMCTFPIVSRIFCELAGGICPREYQRYRIDDHIENIFNLLGVLDERRIVYLPDVVFEHCKVTEPSPGKKVYFLDKGIEAFDGPRYDHLFAQRQQIAFRLKRHIAACQGQTWENTGQLDAVEDTPSLRFIVRGPVLQRLRKCIQQKGFRGLAQTAWNRLNVGLSGKCVP